jgi:hypothetical protein
MRKPQTKPCRAGRVGFTQSINWERQCQRDQKGLQAHRDRQGNKAQQGRRDRRVQRVTQVLRVRQARQALRDHKVRLAQRETQTEVQAAWITQQAGTSGGKTAGLS